jgi:cellulose biosynthesis protein BcsQ
MTSRLHADNVTQRQGKIATFYSYKGGTGRSMALANVAWILAANGEKVLVIDWDLEAPGLHRYFRPFLTDPDLFETSGLIDTFWELTADQVARQAKPAGGKPVGHSSDGAFGGSVAALEEDISAADRFLEVTRRLHRRRLTEVLAPETLADPGATDLFDGDGCIDFVAAGRQGATYSERVNTFDWRGFYELGGAQVLSDLAGTLREMYDWVLIDSRTGVSDTSGICTMQLPDILVPCFTLNRQSIEGVTSVLRAIRDWRSGRPDAPQILFLPVATRIENAEKDRLDAARQIARTALKSFLPNSGKDEAGYWQRMEVTYRPWYAYEEVLASFGDRTDSNRAADSLLAQMENIAQRMLDPFTEPADVDRVRAPSIDPSERSEVLRLFAFASGGKDTLLRGGTSVGAVVTAVQETDRMDQRDPQVTRRDREILRGINRKEREWRRRRKDWRWLLSNGELQFLESQSQTGAGIPYDVTTMSYVQSSQVMQTLLRSLRRSGLLLGLSAIAFLPIVAAVLLPMLSVILQDPLLFYHGFKFPWFWNTNVVALWAGTFGALWLVSAFYRWAIKVDRRPEGMSTRELLALAVRGPFLPEIQDIEMLEADLRPL